MSRKLAEFVHFIKRFRRYRQRGFDYRTAWLLASMTLP
jgi:hypothetical protein